MERHPGTMYNVVSSIADVCSEIINGFSAGCEFRRTLSCLRDQGNTNPLGDPYFREVYHEGCCILSIPSYLAFMAGRIANPIEAGRNHSYLLDCGLDDRTFDD